MNRMDRGHAMLSETSEGGNHHTPLGANVKARSSATGQVIGAVRRPNGALALSGGPRFPGGSSSICDSPGLRSAVLAERPFVNVRRDLLATALPAQHGSNL